jgi:hypothetical protein
MIVVMFTYSHQTYINMTTYINMIVVMLMYVWCEYVNEFFFAF